MQLKAFDKNEKQKNNKTTILVVVVFLFVVTLILGKSFALYQKEESKEVINSVAEVCSIKSGTTWDFEYVEDEEGNGYEQEFEIPCTGNYRLETWGAQGGSYNETYHGGYGGYSKGESYLEKDEIAYIDVGGAGNVETNLVSVTINSGGYNGGGNGSGGICQYPTNRYGASGGGATHIATKSGLLSTLNNDIDDILIVSGGGGGSLYINNDYGYGANAGGYVGNDSEYIYYDTAAYHYYVAPKGGTQSVGGNGGQAFRNIDLSQYAGQFGLGGGYIGSSCANGSGGGSGYYGGGAGEFTSGAGGSGYIGNNNLLNKVMYCYECSESNDESTRTISTTNVSDSPISGYAKQGNGHARITYLGYSEPELNGADPVLKDGLVPVKIGNDGTVRKVNPQVKWYDYRNKEWANAVILVDKTQNYDYGDVIPEANIESYFVWIPKYSYQLWDLGNYSTGVNSALVNNAREIQIKFGITNTSDANTGECTTPMISGASGNCSVGDFMTHPAFISMNTNGLWVGKFETTGTIDSINIKPKMASLKNENIKTMFEASYNYQRTLDSHMMKNTEWGAVAYLSHSKYGINKKIRINNNSNYVTGYSAADSTNQSICPGINGTTLDITQPYNTETGYKASTTGNITGIYDMSGGTYEFVSGYISGNLGSSGFNDSTIASYNAKYFDVYNSSTSITTYQYRILGDATGEIGPFYLYKDDDNNDRYHGWYESISYGISSFNSWGDRGGYFDHGNLSSQFSFNRYSGQGLDVCGFRIVLAP